MRKEEVFVRINDELSKLCFNFSYNGTNYIRDCIYEMYKQNKIYDVNLTKEIFPILCKKYNKSIDTIHSNMKKSIDIMYYDCDEIIIEQYLAYKGKPSLKKLLIKIIENVKE